MNKGVIVGMSIRRQQEKKKKQQTQMNITTWNDKEQQFAPYVVYEEKQEC